MNVLRGQRLYESPASTSHPTAPRQTQSVSNIDGARKSDSFAPRHSSRICRGSPCQSRASTADAPVSVGALSATSQVPYYALVSSAAFLLQDVQNEALAEQLREKRRLYGEQGKALDFCIVSEPSWLDKEFPKESQRVQRPCVALVSADKMWITFMKLRLDRVLMLDLGTRAPESAFSSSAPMPDFPPLDKSKWTAPYAPYRPGWWKMFEPEAVLAQK